MFVPVPWMDVDAAFAEMNALSRRMDALLGRRGLDGYHGLRAAEPAPTVDLEKTDGGYRLAMDLPGVAQDDVSLSAENGTLTLSARRTPTAPAGWNTRYGERRGYELRRTLRLPDDVDVDAIDASLTNGVLTVTLPKRDGAGPRTITVR